MVRKIKNQRKKFLRAALFFLMASLTMVMMPELSRGQGGNLYFVTLKGGLLDPSISDDTFFNQIETTQGHGPLLDDRKVTPISLEFDIYSIGSELFGLGVGLELLKYRKQFRFLDGEKVSIRVQGVHFTFKTFLRLGSVFPFVGLGSGSFYGNIDQSDIRNKTGFSLRDSPDSVTNFRVGSIFLFGRVGLLFEVGRTRAILKIPGESGPATLELGGIYNNVGITFVF